MHKVIIVMLVLFSVYLLHTCDAQQEKKEDRDSRNDRREPDGDNKDVQKRKGQLQKNRKVAMSRISNLKFIKIVQLCTKWAADKEGENTKFDDYVKQSFKKESLENNENKSEPDEDNKAVKKDLRKDEKSHDRKGQHQMIKKMARSRLSPKKINKIVQLCTTWAADDKEGEKMAFKDYVEKFLKEESLKNNKNKSEKFKKAIRTGKKNKQ